MPAVEVYVAIQTTPVELLQENLHSERHSKSELLLVVSRKIYLPRPREGRVVRRHTTKAAPMRTG